MTSWVVVDAGVLLATVLTTEPLSRQADTLLQNWARAEVMPAAPALLQYELIAVIRKHVHRGTLTVDEGESACELLLACPVRLLISESLIRRGYRLASHFGFSTAYDAQYLAVAEYLQCDLWTADRRLFAAVQHELPHVHWLGDFPLPTERNSF